MALEEKDIKTMNTLMDETIDEIGLCNISRSTISYDDFNEEAKKLIEKGNYNYISLDLEEEKDFRTGKTIYKHIESIETNDITLVHKSDIFYDYDTFVVNSVTVKESRIDNTSDIISSSLETLNDISKKQSFITRLSDEYKKFIGLNNAVFRVYPAYTQDKDKFVEVIYKVNKPLVSFNTSVVITENTLSSIKTDDGMLHIKRCHTDSINNPLNDSYLEDIAEEVINPVNIKKKYMV